METKQKSTTVLVSGKDSDRKKESCDTDPPEIVGNATDWRPVEPVDKSANKYRITVVKEEVDGVIRFYQQVTHKKSGRVSRQYLLAFFEPAELGGGLVGLIHNP